LAEEVEEAEESPMISEPLNFPLILGVPWRDFPRLRKMLTMSSSFSLVNSFTGISTIAKSFEKRGGERKGHREGVPKSSSSVMVGPSKNLASPFTTKA